LRKSSLDSLAQNQQQLGKEVSTTVEKELAQTPVIARIVGKSAEAMRKAGDRLAAMVENPPEGKDLPDREAAEDQAEALGRLDQVIKAINEELKNRDRAANNGGGGGGEGNGGGGGGGGGGGPESDGLPPVAQLKLLRALQIEVNERTEAFKKDHPDSTK